MGDTPYSSFLSPIQRLWDALCFHCHVVKHEDKGMMMTVEVVP
jgi:FtsP/CotA-like multicopper oxidase with cupredoxin domain